MTNQNLDPSWSSDLNAIVDEVSKNAWSKGFHSVTDTEDELIERGCNNIHDEVSELHEAWRKGKLHEPCDKAGLMESIGIEPLSCIEEELADILIRVCDVSRRLGVDIASAVYRKHRFNITRPHRHGGKKS